jgi:hypothetical protein
VTDTSLNGGRMSAERIYTGVSGAVFPPVYEAERAALSTIYRKIFAKAHDDADGTLVGAYLFLDFDAKLGDDSVVWWPGTHTNTQGDITGSERKYGAGTLVNAVTAGDSSFVVAFKDASQVTTIQAGDKVRISNKSTPSSTTGTEQTLTVDTIVSTSGNQVTFTTTAGVAYDYVAGVKISTVYEHGDLACALTGTGHTGGADIDFDAIVLDNIGTVYETYSGLMLTSTTFSVTGDTLGALASGSTASDYAPQNSDWSKPLFTIPTSIWSGLTLSAGDTFTFTTVPASIPIWMKKINPADATAVLSNSALICLRGQTA